MKHLTIWDWHFDYTLHHHTQDTLADFVERLNRFYNRVKNDPFQFQTLPDKPLIRSHLIHMNVRAYYRYELETSEVFVLRYFYTHHDLAKLRLYPCKGCIHANPSAGRCGCVLNEQTLTSTLPL
jgi:hypothetical protein